MRQYKTRLDTLEENETAIKEEQEDLAAGTAPKKSNNDDSDEMDDDSDEFEKTKKALAKFKNGEADDYDSEDDDSDYEVAGGDMNLYDSRLDDIDELNFMAETMQGLMQNQQVA